MRRPVDEPRLREFMRALARAETGCVYLFGGACGVLLGWHSETIDIDVSVDPEALLRPIADLKERLEVNVDHIVPHAVPGADERHRFIARLGVVSFYHYDFYTQALWKIERGHRRDLEDVAQMIATGLVERQRLGELFARIEPDLYRYPAIDPASFRAAVEAT